MFGAGAGVLVLPMLQGAAAVSPAALRAVRAVPRHAPPAAAVSRPALRRLLLPRLLLWPHCMVLHVLVVAAAAVPAALPIQLGLPQVFALQRLAAVVLFNGTELYSATTITPLLQVRTERQLRATTHQSPLAPQGHHLSLWSGDSARAVILWPPRAVRADSRCRLHPLDGNCQPASAPTATSRQHPGHARYLGSGAGANHGLAARTIGPSRPQRGSSPWVQCPGLSSAFN
jgi:hypothetical protein